MHALSAHDVLHVWERGRSQGVLECGITILGLSCPELTIEQLYQLTTGERDLRLLQLRELTLGPRLQAFARCPGCHADLEFGVDIRELYVPPAAPAGTIAIQVEGRDLVLRRPTLGDLAMAVHSGAGREAARTLAARCVVSGGEGALTEPAIEAIEAALSQADPQSDLNFDLVCPHCRGQWQALFDIVAFFRGEIAAMARRLLLEVHTLARAYGWREHDILDMTATRRQAYLEMVGA